MIDILILSHDIGNVVICPDSHRSQFHTYTISSIVRTSSLKMSKSLSDKTGTNFIHTFFKLYSRNFMSHQISLALDREQQQLSSSKSSRQESSPLSLHPWRKDGHTTELLDHKRQSHRSLLIKTRIAIMEVVLSPLTFNEAPSTGNKRRFNRSPIHDNVSADALMSDDAMMEESCGFQAAKRRRKNEHHDGGGGTIGGGWMSPFAIAAGGSGFGESWNCYPGSVVHGRFLVFCRSIFGCCSMLQAVCSWLHF